MACFGILRGQFFFYFLSKYFFNFFAIFLLFLFVLRWNFNNICSTFTHSHIFFLVLLGSVSVGRCAFLDLGIDIQVINWFWKIGRPLEGPVLV